MRTLRFLSVAAILSLAASCSVKEDIFSEENRIQERSEAFGEGLSDDALLKEMNIRVTPELEASFAAATGADGYVRLSEYTSLQKQGVVRMRRLFPDAGEFEERTRAEGLHLWYVLTYDEEKSMTKASAGLSIPGVEEIEYCPKIEIVGHPEVLEYPPWRGWCAAGDRYH